MSWRHGTTYGYRKQKCRCAECTEAERLKHKRWRDQARIERRASYLNELEASRAAKENARGACQDCGGPTSWSDSSRPITRCLPCYTAWRLPEHGTLSRYQGGCRCADCRRVNAVYQREYRASRRVAA